jgi:hypothetical protein
MSLVLQSSSGGQITIQEPVTASNFTQTLPAATGTVALLQTPSFATTIGVGGATPAASGAGITFPATFSASTDANTLDDYEEGTWTPADGSGAGLSITTQAATYTKIGRLVTATVYASYPSTANSSQASISGLPFASSISQVYTVNVLSTSANVTAFGRINAGESKITFYGIAASAGNVLNSSLSSNYVIISITYPTA